MEDNWYALVVAILLKVPPETSFKMLNEGSRKVSSALNDNDTLDMLKYREDGITFKEIGEMYGISESAAYRRMKYYKEHKKNRSAVTEAAS
ncbi:MAG: AsnC family protein [Candidatus Margulisbacteria bacterium]|nr:AsnC family protein [Candidatus Margulisiibacteriota bacterium]